MDNKAIVEQYLNELIEEDGHIFLVDYSFLPGNNIKIFLDADDGITIDKCIRINRALYRRIEEAVLFPEGDFAMEVSSPGVDQPLKLNRQYRKNISRAVEVLLNDSTKKEGKLIEVTDDDITIEEKSGSGKKTVIKSTNISFNQIKHTKVLVTF